MPRLSISEVARCLGMRPSAIRYYEKLGLLPAPDRISGQRRYDKTVLYRLAVIMQARRTGFRLDEIRVLFFGFRAGTRADARWRRLADRKMAELDALIQHMGSMRRLLVNAKRKCHCSTLEDCGKAILERGISAAENPVRPPKFPGVRKVNHR